MKGWDYLKSRTTIQVRNGMNTKFWWDRWVGESSLKVAFPLLFNLASDKNATIAEVWDGGRNGGHWSLSSVQKAFSGLGNDAVIQFLKLIYPVGVQGVGLSSLQ